MPRNVREGGVECFRLGDSISEDQESKGAVWLVEGIVGEDLCGYSAVRTERTKEEAAERGRGPTDYIKWQWREEPF